MWLFSAIILHKLLTVFPYNYKKKTLSCFVFGNGPALQCIVHCNVYLITIYTHQNYFQYDLYMGGTL